MNLLLLLKVNLGEPFIDRFTVFEIHLTKLMVNRLIGLSELNVDGLRMFLIDFVHLLFQLFLILYERSVNRLICLVELVVDVLIMLGFDFVHLLSELQLVLLSQARYRSYHILSMVLFDFLKLRG